MKDMIALESELVNRDIQITSLKDELSQTKASISVLNAKNEDYGHNESQPFFYHSLGLRSR